jgi:hypothetical protein
MSDALRRSLTEPCTQSLLDHPWSAKVYVDCKKRSTGVTVMSLEKLLTQDAAALDPM